MTDSPPEYQPAVALHATRPAVEEYAVALARAYGFQPGAPIEALVKSLGGQLLYKHVFEEGDGSLLVHGRGFNPIFTIYASYFSGAERNRFTIAHELGHYALHSSLGELRIRAARKATSEAVEWEANWFAAALLMPESEFRQQLKRHRSTGAVDLAAVARHFGVSWTAANVRAEVLGGCR